MSISTAGELTLLRTQPHRTKFYLSIYKPNTVLSCQVNDGSIEKGDRVITYNNVTSGSHLLVKRGMTLRVGSIAGDDDYGVIYVKSADATTITVGENSHINWQDDLYLTVLDFFQIWPVYPRYTQDGEDITVYKDYDVVYSDQNENMGALVCMGPHHAGLLVDGEHQVYYDASETVQMTNATGSYSWHFVGGDPTGSSVQVPGYVSYDTPGHYTTYLTVTNTNGSIETSARHISIYDKPGEGNNPSILSWGFASELSGDRNAGGYSVQLWVKENIDDIQDGALVVLFTEDWYGTIKQSIGGNAPNRESILFVGYILGNSIIYDYQDSTVTFTVSSPTELMKLVEAFSVSVEDSTNPSNDANLKGGDPWFYLVGLTMQTALYHYIRWHSTINLCCDVEYNATDFNLQFFDADRSSLYDAVNALMESAVIGKTVCDRQGKVWFEVEYEAINNAATNLPLNMFLDNHDWMGELSIKENVVNSLSFVEMGGVYWQGAVANTFSPMLSNSPGDVPNYRGKSLRLSGLALISQPQLNILCGNVYANRNARFPEVGIVATGNYRNFDIAPQERVTITIENKTFRQLNWVQKSFAVRRISWRLDQSNKLAYPVLSVAEIVQGFNGDTVPVPEIPPDVGYSPPKIKIPPLPAFPTIEIPTISSFSSYPVYIPVMAGEIGESIILAEDAPNSAYDNDSGAAVFNCTSPEWAIATGNFIIPYDYSGTITIYTLIMAQSDDSGNIVTYTTHESYNRSGDAYSYSDGVGNYYLDAMSLERNIIYFKWPEELVVAPGSFVTLSVTRDGTDGDDTYPDTLHIVGWYIYYG